MEETVPCEKKEIKTLNEEGRREVEMKGGEKKDDEDVKVRGKKQGKRMSEGEHERITMKKDHM